MNRQWVKTTCGVLSIVMATMVWPWSINENAFAIQPAVTQAASDAKLDSPLADSVGIPPQTDNPTMIQYFEWYLPNDGEHWNRLARDASNLKEAGIDSVWIPPAYKGGGSGDVGYGVYDVYDLGEFDQKGSVRTKYGFKDQLQKAIAELKKNNISVYGDVVINHKGNQDGTDTVRAVEVDPRNRNQPRGGEQEITAYTRFDFWGRGDKYSSFKWNAWHFSGNDPGGRIFRFTGPGKGWNTEVDPENGNYDFLMFADIDYNNPEVAAEMKKWGTWFTNELDLDGFRLDAVKHIKFEYMKDWLTHVRKATGKNLFSVGEYWSGNVDLLKNYLLKTGYTTALFDVPLHYRFYDASRMNGNYDMKELFKNTLASDKPEYAVTFVDNHDTQPGQALFSFVGNHFKAQAYAFIMTRQEGIPMVFYGDYYGNNNHGMQEQKAKINTMLKARKLYSYGKQTDYFNDSDVIGWTRQGDSKHVNSGLAAVITDGRAGSVEMNVGKQHAGETWYDMTGNRSDTVVIQADGSAEFKVNERSVSIYVVKGDVPRQSVISLPDKATPAPTKRPADPDSGSNENNGSEDSGNQADAKNSVTIYYQTSGGFANPHAYFRRNGAAWGTATNVAFKPSSVSGYAELTIPLNGADGIEVAFNDNNGKWDSRNRQNYLFPAGVSTFIPGGNEGTVKSGGPVTVTPVPTAKPTVKAQATAKPTAKPKATPVPTPEPVVEEDGNSDLPEVTFTAAQVSQAIKSKSALVLNEQRGKLILPEAAVSLVRKSGIELSVGNVSMTLTAELIQSILKAITRNKLTVDSIALTIDLTSESVKADLLAKAKENYNETMLPGGDLYDFELLLTTKTGEAYAIEKFETPILVQMKLPEDTNAERVGLYYVDADGNLEFVGGRTSEGVLSATVSHFSTYGPFEYYKTYDDVAEDHPNAQAIEQLSAKHIVSGVSYREFAPEKSVTRAEFASILVRALGLEPAEPVKFSDVKSNAWYADAVSAASGAGIVTGKGKNTFLPNAKITRQEMAAMVVRAYEGLTGTTVSEDAEMSYSDARNIQTWARGYVGAAQQLGLFEGRGSKFDPMMPTTRAEASQAIYNLLNQTSGF